MWEEGAVWQGGVRELRATGGEGGGSSRKKSLHSPAMSVSATAMPKATRKNNKTSVLPQSPAWLSTIHQSPCESEGPGLRISMCWRTGH